MTPDDPRHGSHAGAVQHDKAHEPRCAACSKAANRDDKRRRYLKHIGQAPTVELGERAWLIVDTGPLNRIAHATGMTHHRLRAYIDAGPQHLVHRATRDRILATDDGWTVIGLQRRLRALTMIGWSMRQLADRSGVAVDSLKRLRGSKDRQFVKHNVATAVLALYDDLHMTPALNGPSRTKTLADARGRGWVAPLAWGSRDIDDPNATPHVGTKKRNPHHEQTDERHATLADLDTWGYGISEACRRLNTSRDALEAWSYRHGEADVYQRLVERENYAEKVNGATVERRAG